MGTTAQKLQAILDSKESIRQAINAKGVAVNTSEPLDGYAGKISQISAGIEINELVKQYEVAPGETITAGSFVDYIKGDFGFYGSEVSFQIPYGGHENAMSLISPNKVILMYRGAGSSYNIGTINNNSITWGQQIFFLNDHAYTITPVVLNETTMAYLYRDDDSVNKNLVLRRATINQQSITTTSTTNVSTGVSVRSLSMDKLTSSKTIIVYSEQTNSGYGTAQIANIPSTGSVTLTPKSIFHEGNTHRDGFYNMEVKVISPDKFIVVYNGSNGLSCKIGTISENTITWGNEAVISSSGAVYVSISVLGNTKVVITYIGTQSKAYHTVVTITENTISLSANTIFNNASTNYLKSTALDSNTIVSAYRDSDTFGKSRVGIVSGNGITWSGQTTFNPSPNQTGLLSIVKIDSTRFLTNYIETPPSTTNFYSSRIGESKNLIVNPTSEKVFGLAKTSGTAGQTIEVYVNE
jgi:hypothetical protein